MKMEIDLTENLQFVNGYTHRSLTPTMVEYCEDVLRAFQSNDGCLTKDEMHNDTGIGYATLTTVLHILRNGVCPKYNITITVRKGVYLLTGNREVIQSYAFSRLTDTLANLKTERSVTRVWVAVSKGHRDKMSRAARDLLRKLDFIIDELEAYHSDYVYDMTNTRQPIPAVVIGG